jgi:hypothetical protein
MVKLTDPEPVTVAALVTVIQGTCGVAVHVHPAVVVTLTVAGPPPAGAVMVVDERAKEQGTPSCVIGIVCPAILSAPDREVGVVLGRTVTPTVPFPVRPVPFVTMIHDSRELAVHWHADPVLTLAVSVPPAAAKCVLAGGVTV